MRGVGVGLIAVAAVVLSSASAVAMTIEDAIRRTVLQNPSIGEAAANRRATEFELKQAYGLAMPQVGLQGSVGASKTRTDQAGAFLRSDKWYQPVQGGVVVRQLIFDGFATANEIYRQAARVDSAALRVRERSELLALDAAESYVDILRHQALLRIARDNIDRHQEILMLVDARVQGGSGSDSELAQAAERLAAAEAVEVDVRKSLEETGARFRRLVGADPVGLVQPRGVAGLPPTKAAAVNLARQSHPTLQVAAADIDAAGYNVRRVEGSLYPSLSAEGRFSSGNEIIGTRNHRGEAVGLLSMNFTVFDGGVNLARRGEAVERLGEAQIRQDTLRRQVDEAAERAFINRSLTGERIRSLGEQAANAEKAARGFRQEYEAGRRSLLDLLDAQNTLFNARTQLTSARFIRTFADYQLAANTGQLLAKLNVPTLPESATGVQESWGRTRSGPGGVVIEPLRQ